MEIKPEQKDRGRLRFLWLLLIANLVLVFGVWQYHRLLVEISDGATLGIYERLTRRQGVEGDLQSRSLRVALLRSEPTALSFGDNRDGYFQLVESWRQLLEEEGFGYQVVDQVPAGAEADRFNLLLLPASGNLSQPDREAVKAFLRSGRGVVMTWATGTRDEYGQWQRYSLLQEVAGLDMAPPPPVRTSDNLSTVMLSGGYPLTANLYPGITIEITAFDQPISAHVRESRTRIDGVWINPDDAALALHSLRDRVAVAHGNYFEGRYAWLGFTIGSAKIAPDQQESFRMLLRSTLLWAGHQVHAFKPVWPDGRMSMTSITLNILTPEDLDPALLSRIRRQRIPVTAFVHPDVMSANREAVAQLAEWSEIGILLDPETDYAARPMSAQLVMLQALRAEYETTTGFSPLGLRVIRPDQYSDATLDAAVRAGFRYLSVRQTDRMVPRPVREFRPVRWVTRPRTLWVLPEMPYVKSADAGPTFGNTLLAQYAQVASLGGYFNLSFRPSQVEIDFADRFDRLLETLRRTQGPIETVHRVSEIWEAWDHIKVTVRHLSPERAAINISNTFTEEVPRVVINLEMPFEQKELDLSSMTLGSRLPDRMTSSGVRWQLHLDRLGPGKNVSYYVNVARDERAPRRVVELDAEPAVRRDQPEVW